MSMTGDTVATTPVRRSATGVALICAQAIIASPLVEGSAAGGSEADIHAGVAAAILRHTALDVVLLAGPEAASHTAIAHCVEPVPDAPGRLRVVAAERLEGLLPGVDMLVSFASPSLVAGCRAGLKPVQIGRAVIGSAAFSHVFPDIAAFAAALADGGLAGSLSLREYEEFEAFCRHVRGRGGLRSLAARRSVEDPIAQACRPAHTTARRALRAVSSVFANPFGAWRLIRAGFGATTVG